MPKKTVFPEDSLKNPKRISSIFVLKEELINKIEFSNEL